MAGLDKIISQILDDARNEADDIIKKAQAEADRILADARENSQKIEMEAAAKRAADMLSYRERLYSSAELRKRQEILGQKQRIIEEMLKKAYETLINQDTDEYFVLIEKMLREYVLAKQGEIYFSEKDLNRMPDDFEAKIEKIAAEKGGGLKLIKEPKQTDGGFVLVYGGVEENCSFKAIMQAKRDQLSDRVHEMLFL